MTPSTFSRLLPLALLSAALLLSGCASRFERAWKNAPAPTRNEPLAGRWEGNWTSEKHKGHGGRLRGVMLPQGNGVYRAEFKAHWLAFSSTYSVDFQTRLRNGVVHFQGEHDLGRLYGGVYSFIGHADAKSFRSSYDSSYDRGVFQMTRPQEAATRR
jgi:hypothetical protein